MEAVPALLPDAEMAGGLRHRGLALLSIELSKQQQRPPGKDKLIAARSQALLNEIEQDGPFAEVIEDVGFFHGVHNPNGASPSEVVGILGATIDTYLLDNYSDFPGDTYRNPGHWRKPLREIKDILVDDPNNPDSEELTFNLISRNVQTNIARRYLPIELIMQMLRSRFPDGVRWLDIGSGVMEGNHQLVLKDKHPFEPLKVMRRNGTHDSALSKKADKLLRLPSIIKSVVCVDREYIYNNRRNEYMPGIVEWSRGCLRPTELMNERFMTRFNSLLAEKSPLVTFQQADFSEESDVEEFKEVFGEGQFEVISYVTMLHQLPPEKRAVMRRVGKSMLKQGGVIIEQDFIYGRGRRPTNLQVFQHWHEPGNYRTYLLDSLDQNGTYQEVFRNRDSRITSIAPGIGNLLVGSEHKSIAELLLKS